MNENARQSPLTGKSPRRAMGQFCLQFQTTWTGLNPLNWARIQSDEIADEELLMTIEDIDGAILVLRDLIMVARKYITGQKSPGQDPDLDSFAMITHDLAVYVDRAKGLSDLIANRTLEDKEQSLQCRRFLANRLNQIDKYVKEIFPSLLIQKPDEM